MRTLVVLLSLLAAILGQEPQPRLRPDWSVVLPEAQARTLGKPCTRPAPGPVEGIWIPDDATIRRLETALAPALQKAIETSTKPGIKPAVSDFYRQYAGFVISGRQVVYVNGFHRAIVDPGYQTTWRTDAVLQCDGAMLLFGAEFRVDTGAIEKITFNAPG